MENGRETRAIHTYPAVGNTQSSPKFALDEVTAISIGHLFDGQSRNETKDERICTSEGIIVLPVAREVDGNVREVLSFIRP